MKHQLFLCALIGCALPVAPALAQLDEARNAPATTRAGELPFRQITPEEAQALAIVKPITLNLQDVSLRAALEELARQSGAQIKFTNDVTAERLDKKLSLQLEAGSVRQAFDAIVRAAGAVATLQGVERNGTYWVNWNQMRVPTNQPQAGVGQFQIQLQKLSLNSLNTLSMNPLTRKITRDQNGKLNLQLSSIDDLGASRIGQPTIRLTRADDENGRSLLLPQPAPYKYDMMLYGNSPIQAQLSAPAEGAQKLAHLEGEATYVLSAKNLTWELPDIVNSKGAAREFPSAGQTIRVEVESAKIGDESVTVNLDVNAWPADEATAPQAPTETDRAMMGPTNPLLSVDVLLAALRIEDANGQILRSGALKAQIISGEISIQAQFFATENMYGISNEKLEVVGPLKLVFDGPVEWVQTQVPFAFKDVPLP